MTLDANFNPFSSSRVPTFAARGMVACSHPLAAQAGLDMLKQGGNAVDAAIAAAACLTVVEPTGNGIGGDAFAILWDAATGKLHGLNASGRAPMGISIQKVRVMGHSTMPRFGFAPVTVPGIPSAWAALVQRFGKLSLARSLSPAVDYARHGHAVAPVVGKYWEAAHNVYKNLQGDEFKPWFDTFAPGGKPPKTGQIVTLPQHADTLQEIGETNAEAFYHGRLAREICNFSAAHGGFITQDDLAAHMPEWVSPVSINYRGTDVYEMPPNGQGLVALIALNILKQFEFSDTKSIENYHRQFEAIKLAFAAGKEHITDPAHMRIGVDELLSEAFAARLREQITGTAHQPAPSQPRSGGTVYLCAADAAGNMISYIQSNYMGFGSGLVVPGTGIALQNRGCDFSLEPTHANALAGGKRTYHTIIPGFLMKNGAPIGPFGIMGGYMQPQAHVQVLSNLIENNHNPQAALDAPRWQWMDGKNITVEHTFPLQIVQKLAQRGHAIQVQHDSGSFGRGQIILRTPDGALVGGTESRCDGAIACF